MTARRLDHEQVVKDFKEGKTPPEIAQEHHCSKTTVYDILRKYGIKRERPPTARVSENTERMVVKYRDEHGMPWRRVAEVTGLAASGSGARRIYLRAKKAEQERQQQT